MERSNNPSFDPAKLQIEEDQSSHITKYDEDYDYKKLELFGRNVGQVPCFRNTFLYGLTLGFGGGIAHFAFTSKVANATRFGVYSSVGISFCYWIWCRYNYAVTRFHYRKLQHLLERNALTEGTPESFDNLQINELQEKK